MSRNRQMNKCLEEFFFQYFPSFSVFRFLSLIPSLSASFCFSKSFSVLYYSHSFYLGLFLSHSVSNPFLSVLTQCTSRNQVLNHIFRRMHSNFSPQSIKNVHICVYKCQNENGMSENGFAALCASRKVCHFTSIVIQMWKVGRKTFCNNNQKTKKKSTTRTTTQQN